MAQTLDGNKSQLVTVKAVSTAYPLRGQVQFTSILTLLIAAALGVAITRSITGPLARLVGRAPPAARGA